MRTALTALTVAGLTAALTVTMLPSAAAADLSGRWNAEARRSGDPGYSMKVVASDSPANAYSVVLRFHYQDGRVGPRIKAGMTTNGNRLFLLIDGEGGLADQKDPNIMKGTLGQDGSMSFPTCYKQLTFVTKKTADSGCLFQEFRP